MLNSFACSNFNYCPLLWHFCPGKLLNETEKIQEQTLRILWINFFDDYESIINKSGKSAMKVKRVRNLALEIFKTAKIMNPGYMKEIFHGTAFSTHRLLNLDLRKTIQLNMETKV